MDETMQKVFWDIVSVKIISLVKTLWYEFLIIMTCFYVLIPTDNVLLNNELTFIFETFVSFFKLHSCHICAQ